VRAPVYKPLYPAEGAPVSGYQCNAKPDCRRVTRTLRGMVLHLILGHGIRIQAELFPAEREAAK
jgi:hypothetical protein